MQSAANVVIDWRNEIIEIRTATSFKCRHLHSGRLNAIVSWRHELVTAGT